MSIEFLVSPHSRIHISFSCGLMSESHIFLLFYGFLLLDPRNCKMWDMHASNKKRTATHDQIIKYDKQYIRQSGVTYDLAWNWILQNVRQLRRTFIATKLLLRWTLLNFFAVNLYLTLLRWTLLNFIAVQIVTLSLIQFRKVDSQWRNCLQKHR